MTAICPGQDTRYWRPDDIFDINCGNCGAAVEFFKDDVHRRCHKCGTLVQNPKITLGCAQWCEHAKECLGYDPKELVAEAGEESSRFENLLSAVKQELVHDPEALGSRIAVVDEVEELLREEKAERKLLLSAALLGGLDSEVAQRLLEGAGFDSRIGTELGELDGASRLHETERQLLLDARRLVELRRRLKDAQGSLDESTALDRFETAPGRKRAKTLLDGQAFSE